MINDTDSAKPRGYAFIEYEHERDMHSKYLNDLNNCRIIETRSKKKSMKVIALYSLTFPKIN